MRVCSSESVFVVSTRGSVRAGLGEGEGCGVCAGLRLAAGEVVAVAVGDCIARRSRCGSWGVLNAATLAPPRTIKSKSEVRQLLITGVCI